MIKRKQLFWTPCVAYCLDLILINIEDLSIHNDIMSKARKITIIYMHSWVLNLIRKHTKKKGLVRVGITRFATSYLTLRRLHKTKIGLKALFSFEEWQRNQYSKKTNNIKVRDIILAN